MKEIHFKLTSGSGLCNSIYSLQLALIISYITKKKLFIYNSNISFYNSHKGYNLLSFFNLNDPSIEIVEKQNCNLNIYEYPLDLISPDLAFFFKEKPDNDFLLHRNNAFDLSELKDISICFSKKTFNFYSYLFFLNTSLYKDAISYMKFVLSIKPEFIYLANSLFIFKNNEYNCVSIRRGDFLTAKNLTSVFLNHFYEVEDFLNVLLNNFNSNDPLVVLSDEIDLNYFKTIEKHFNNVFFLNIEYLKNGQSDRSLIGLLGIIIALKSKKFIGTMGSTYSTYIQQSRALNKKQEEFMYLYSQRPCFVLDEFGKCIENNNNKYSWNRVYTHHTSNDELSKRFWPLLREWPECSIK